MIVIEIEGVSHRFGDLWALHDITLRLTERRIAILGANGSGKSTFARLLNALLIPETGSVRIDGLDTRAEARAVRRRVGFVFQNPDNQIVMPTVEEDVAFGLRNLKLPRATVAERVTRALERYGIDGLRDRSAHLLSGGEKQLLAIAGVLAMTPEIVVFDEPTTLLDLRNKRRIAAAIQGLAERAVVVSHDLPFIADFDRAIVFDGGRVVMDGPPADAIRYYEKLIG